MTIPMLAGWGDSLAPVSQAIAGFVDKKMHPNKHMEEVMQQAFAQNPDLLQKFADLEKNAPGTAERLGLGRLANIIKFVPESDEQALGKETKDLKKGATVAALTASKATNEYNATKLQKYAEYAKDHPDVTLDAWYKQETGSTQLDIKEQKINIAGKEIVLNEKTRDAELVAHLPPVEGQQMVEDVNKMLRGQFTPDMVPRIAAYQNGVYKEAFGALVSTGSKKIDNDQQNRTLDMQAKGLARQDRGLNLEERRVKLAESEAGVGGLKDSKANLKFQRTEAMQAFEKGGYVGSLDAWVGLLFDPEVQKRANGLLDGTIKLRPGAEGIEDQALLRAAQANRDSQALRTSANAAKIGKQIQTGMSQVESA
nr:hypothetical protein [Blastocatellia bacterium]